MKVLFVAPFDGVVGGIRRWAEHIYDYYSFHGQNAGLKLEKFSIGRTRLLASNNFLRRIILALSDYVEILSRYRKTLKGRKYDIIHISSSASLSLLKDLWMIRLAHRSGAKAVVHFHFGRIPDLYQQQNWEWKLLKRVVAYSDAVVVMTEDSYRALLDAGFKNVYKVPNPLSPAVADFVDIRCDAIREPGVVLFVGQVIKTKGVLELLDACSMLDNVHLKIVGQVPDEMQDVVMQRISKIGKETVRVEVVGVLPYERVLEQMLMCDVFVLPTYTEGFPNVILEGMACGCAIVSTKVGAIPEMLEEDAQGQYGILVSPRNVEQLASAMGKMLQDEDLKLQCRKNVRRRVYERYSMAIVWNDLLNVWDRVKNG